MLSHICLLGMTFYSFIQLIYVYITYIHDTIIHIVRFETKISIIDNVILWSRNVQQFLLKITFYSLFEKLRYFLQRLVFSFR